MVARVSPNCEKNALISAISSGLLSFEMLHASAEIDTTSSQDCIVFTSKLGYAPGMVIRHRKKGRGKDRWKR